MGLVRGLVLALDRRAVLAVLAISVSVAYALVAGATVTGLEDAQASLGTDPDEVVWLAQHPDQDATPLDEAPGTPTHGIAIATLEEHERRFYTAQTPDGPYPLPLESPDHVLAGPASGYEDGEMILVRDHNLTVQTGDPVQGAPNTALGLNPDTFTDVTTHDPSQAHVLVYEELSPNLEDELHEAGYETHQAPASLAFYEAGADQLITAIAVTVAASTLVVALLASGFVTMELRAKRRSLATLKTYGGTSLVRRIVAARGMVLVTAGHLVGLALTVGLVLVVSRAGALDLFLDPTFTGAALAATYAGGLLGLAPPLATASKRLEAKDLAQRSPPSWLPKPLRLTLTSWRIAVPLTAAAIVLAASLGVVYGTVDMPSQLFGHEGDEVLAPSGNPLRGEVDPFHGHHLSSVDGFTGSSPEIFAPTLLGGSPIMARGVDWDQLGTMEPELTLVQGTAFTNPNEATIGHRAADKHDLDPGDTITVPSPYTTSTTKLTITGTHQAGTLLDDEILTSLDTAREITGQRAGTVSLVRYERAPDAQPALPDGIEVTRLDVTPTDPLPHEHATATLDLVNFAQRETTRQLTLTLNGDPIADAFPTLPARSTGTTEMTFRVPPTDTLNLAVNPQRDVQSGTPAYTLDAPTAALTNTTLDVTVTDQDGNPAPGVTVRLDENQARTSDDGTASIPATTTGNRTLIAQGPDGRGATWIVLVERGHLHVSHPVVTSVNGPTTLAANETWDGVITVENQGGNHHDGPVPVPVNDTTENTTSTEIPSGQQARIPLQLTFQDADEHTIGPPETALTVTVTPPGEPDDEPPARGSTVEELLEERRSQASSSEQAGQSATQAFLGETFENLNAALTIVTLATVLHAGLVTAVAVFREVEERSGIIGTLASVGAGQGDLRVRAVREFGTVGALSAVLGAVVGLVLAWLGAQLGLLSGFGHALVPRAGVVFGAQVAVAAFAVTVLVAVFAVDRVRGRQASSLLREGPERASRPGLERLIGGSGPDA